MCGNPNFLISKTGIISLYVFEISNLDDGMDSVVVVSGLFAVSDKSLSGLNKSALKVKSVDVRKIRLEEY